MSKIEPLSTLTFLLLLVAISVLLPVAHTVVRSDSRHSHFGLAAEVGPLDDRLSDAPVEHDFLLEVILKFI